MANNMENKKRSDKRKRTEKIYFRVTPEEKDAFNIRCENAGLSPSDYLRKSALKMRPLKPTTDTKLLAQMLSEWGRIGNNLNQLARHYNAGNAADQKIGRELVEIVSGIRADIRKGLGHDN